MAKNPLKMQNPASLLGLFNLVLEGALVTFAIEKQTRAEPAVIPLMRAALRIVFLEGHISSTST